MRCRKVQKNLNVFFVARHGTAAAAVALLRQVGADVCAAAFIMELSFLGGRKRLDVPVTTLLTYDS